MIVLGLTGSIGMGKSRVASMMRKLGIPVHDSDRAVHAALMPKGAAFEMVAVTFPECWDKKRRIIDRKKLGKIVFEDAKKLKKLEKILHPIARKSQMEFIQKMRKLGRKMVVLEIPLLFETGAEARVDFTVCVSAPKEIQRSRVMARKNMTAEKFEQILSRQMPDDAKRANSDFVINTGLGLAQTMREIKSMLREINA